MQRETILISIGYAKCFYLEILISLRCSLFKNFIIIILIILLGSLLFNNEKNVELLVGNMADTKNKVVDGVKYLNKTFDKEFEVHDEPFTGIKEDTFFEEK